VDGAIPACVLALAPSPAPFPREPRRAPSPLRPGAVASSAGVPDHSAGTVRVLQGYAKCHAVCGLYELTTAPTDNVPAVALRSLASHRVVHAHAPPHLSEQHVELSLGSEKEEESIVPQALLNLGSEGANLHAIRWRMTAKLSDGFEADPRTRKPWASGRQLKADAVLAGVS
jgi:hypothetical protein